MTTAFLGVYLAVTAVAGVYAIRHYLFTLGRLFGRPHGPRAILAEDWPTVTVVVPAHNERDVIERSLVAILASDYPADKLTVVAIDDRSTDDTGAVIDAIAARAGGRLVPVHRRDGPGGKPAALLAAMTAATGDVLVQFDADYRPGPDLIRRLVAPFADPRVGLVMGRVVPENVGPPLVTRLLDLERAGGYQVEQQARMTLGLPPLYGGTVGGIRRAALVDVGGWRPGVLTEDTDLTVRCLLRGWAVVYLNAAECYEQVPDGWAARWRQVGRWARGHNQCLARYGWRVLTAGRLPARVRLDALLLLGVFLTPPFGLLGLAAAVALVLSGDAATVAHTYPLLAAAAVTAVGNFAPFFQLAAAAHLDGPGRRVRLLPLVVVSSLVSAGATTAAVVAGAVGIVRRREARWHRTPHRPPPPAQQTSTARSTGPGVRTALVAAGAVVLVAGVGLGWAGVSLVVVTGVLLGLPLVPAVAEWWRPTDARPLDIPERKPETAGLNGPAAERPSGAAGGGPSPVGRAYRGLPLRRRTLAATIGLSALFTAAAWLSLPAVAALWGVCVEAWAGPLFGTGVHYTDENVLGRPVRLTCPDECPPEPPPALAAGVLLGCGVIGAWLIRRSRRGPPGPAAVLVLIVMSVQAAAAAANLMHPGPPGFGLRAHVAAGQAAALYLLLAVPAAHGLVYHPFPFAAWRKAGLTALTVLYIGMAVPHLYLMHACLASRLTELLIPVLFAVGGSPTLVLGSVALYGYAMSWPRQG